MRKWPFIAWVILPLLLPACAGQKTAERREIKSMSLILVSRNGTVHLDQQEVQLPSLVRTLKASGVNEHTKLSVKAENGTEQKHIVRVLETLVEGGLLPKDTID